MVFVCLSYLNFEVLEKKIKKRLVEIKIKLILSLSSVHSLTVIGFFYVFNSKHYGKEKCIPLSAYMFFVTLEICLNWPISVITINYAFSFITVRTTIKYIKKKHEHAIFDK